MNLTDFHAYVKSFYGPGGIYDMAATDLQINHAIAIYLARLNEFQRARTYDLGRW